MKAVMSTINTRVVSSITNWGNVKVKFIFVSELWYTSAALIYATHHDISRKFGGKWKTECLNIRYIFGSRTQLCCAVFVLLEQI